MCVSFPASPLSRRTAAIAQSVLRFATGWTARETNPPIPVAERPKARVCGRSLAGVAGSKPAGGMEVRVVCVVQ